MNENMPDKLPAITPAVIAPQPSPAMDAYALIMRAVSDDKCDPAKLRELLAVRREWNADESAAAFNAAVVDFQRQCPIIEKGDTANSRAYARMDRIWRAIRPLLDKCGLAVTWESVKSVGDVCILDGHLRHSRGHAQTIHHEMPNPDKITGQNSAQRAGSGESYCKRYAVLAALGINTGEDDDGNGGVKIAMTDAHAAQLRALCAEFKIDEARVAKACGNVAKLEEIADAAFQAACALVRTAAKAKQQEAKP